MYVTTTQRDLAIDTLRSLVERFPIAAFDDAGFTEAALRDVFENTLGRERQLLLAAARTVAPSRFAAAAYRTPDAPTLAQIDRIPADALWACEAWRRALGVAAATSSRSDGIAPPFVPPVHPDSAGQLFVVGLGSLVAVALLFLALIPIDVRQLVAIVAPQPSDTATPAASPSAAAQATPLSLGTIAPFSHLLPTTPPATVAAERASCLADWRAGNWNSTLGSCLVASVSLPDDPLVQLGLGEADVALKKDSLAVKPLEAAAKLETDRLARFASTDVKDRGIAYENRGYANYELGFATGTTEYYRRAKDDFHSARGDGVGDVTVLYYFADSGYQLDAWCDAALAFQTLLQNPGDLDSVLKKQAEQKMRYAAGQCKP